MTPQEINQLIQQLPEDQRDQVSDGYHTFNELYEHRCRLFIALCHVIHLRGDAKVWKSWKHCDLSTWNGWFIMGINFEDLEDQITYHLPARLWDTAEVPERDHAMTWDGHTPGDVLERLLNLF